MSFLKSRGISGTRTTVVSISRNLSCLGIIKSADYIRREINSFSNADGMKGNYAVSSVSLLRLSFSSSYIPEFDRRMIRVRNYFFSHFVIKNRVKKLLSIAETNIILKFTILVSSLMSFSPNAVGRC